MLNSFVRSMSVAMLIVGTVIGAGFASGREIVTFFGDVPDMLVAFVCAALVFLCSMLFMFVGRRAQKSDIGEVNGAVFGRLRPIADVFMLFNSMSVLGAMLAGTDALFAEYLDIRPFASVILGIASAFVCVKGMKGVIKVNAVLVPVMVVFLAVCSLSVIKFPFAPKSGGIRIAPVILYVSMNMILGGSVLTTVKNLSKREIILSSAVAAVIIGGLLLCLIGALADCSAAYADMPILVIALKSGRGMYFTALPVIGASVFTTMISAFKSVYDYVRGIIKNDVAAAGTVLVTGLAVGAFGFSNVVSALYPVIGGIGLIYIAANVWYLIRTRVKRRVRRSVRRLSVRRRGGANAENAIRRTGV